MAETTPTLGQEVDQRVHPGVGQEVGEGIAEKAEALEPGLIERLSALRARVENELWDLDPKEPFALRAARIIAQLVVLTVRGFRSDQLMLRASALTYVTAISIIPTLGVVFAILQMVGGDETLVDFVIEQLTTVAPDVQETVRGYVGNLDFASFGTIGGAIVFGMAILALRHLEMTLNDIWGVTNSRSWARRFADYLAVLVVAPISTGVAVSVATTLQSQEIFGHLLEDSTVEEIYGLGLAQVPFVFLFVAFTFLYWFFPNTRVRLWAAALGGVLAAILFQAARTIYVEFQVGAATYQAVFGALSAIPLILAWLYACWAVILLGAEVAYAAQNLSSARREMRRGAEWPAEREVLAVELAVAIGRCFARGETPPTADRLADQLHESVREVRRLLDRLLEAGQIHTVSLEDGAERGYAPALPLARLTLGDVLHAVRGVASEDMREEGARSLVVARAIGRLEGAWSRVADETTLADIVAAADPVPTAEGSVVTAEGSFPAC